MSRIGQPYGAYRGGDDFDTIVIGSGIGGLMTAVLLARHGGRRVLVLERHYTAGGFTHVFHRPGYEWDVGIHYIGEVHRPRSMMRRLFDHLTDGGLQWEWLGDVYDRICFPDRTYDFVAGSRAFVDRLAEDFPAEKKAIEGYVDAVKQAAGAARLYFAEKAAPAPVAQVFGGLMRRRFLKHSDRRTLEVLEGFTGNRQLIGVLAGQYGDYGLPPAESSFAIHAIVAAHYLEGACYPIGGASRIAATALPIIEAAGGAVLINAEVAEILVADGRAVGVRMADGREFRAPVVASDAGIANTFQRLLPAATTKRLRLDQVTGGLEPSAAHLCLYIGLQGTDEELGLTRPNLWLYPGYDHDANVAAYRRDPEAPFPLVYVSFPSAKDPTFRERHPGRSTIDVITFAPYERFSPWQDGRWKRRGEDYEELKQRFAERLLAVLYERLPQIQGKVDTYELSTPLTTRHFANHPTGEIYGLAHTPARFRCRALRPRTPVRGLYLTGADVATAGIGGALIGGVLAASAILGRNMIDVVGRAEAERHAGSAGEDAGTPRSPERAKGS